jgi:hypothetical protein
MDENGEGLNYILEGPIGFVSPSPQCARPSMPVYRFFDPKFIDKFIFLKLFSQLYKYLKINIIFNKILFLDHHYISDGAEFLEYSNPPGSGYIYQGIAFYVFPMDQFYCP